MPGWQVHVARLRDIFVKKFSHPERWLSGLGPQALGSILGMSTDVSLVLDPEGVVEDVCLAVDDLELEAHEGWLGRPWMDTVTGECRGKIQALLREAGIQSSPRWRQVNHPSGHGHDIPVSYIAVPLGASGRSLALGRDLRAVSALQRRLVETQQQVEREYARLRHAETRYRMLFQVSSEAVLIVDATSHKVIEANPAALQLLGETLPSLLGRVFPEGFDLEETRPLQDMLAIVRATGRSSDVRVDMGDRGELQVAGSLFRQDSNAHFLLRLRQVPEPHRSSGEVDRDSQVMAMLDTMSDGFVLTDAEGVIQRVNPAFLELAQVAAEMQMVGQSLGRWLGRPGVDLSVMLNNLREYGVVRLFPTDLRGDYGSVKQVEISAVSVPDGHHPCMGFIIRPTSGRLADGMGKREGGAQFVEQITELVGRIPLKDLVRESTDMIERLCIEAALDLCHDNRASAAEMLGLSRQSFYVKLRRYRLGDLTPESG